MPSERASCTTDIALITTMLTPQAIAAPKAPQVGTSATSRTIWVASAPSELASVAPVRPVMLSITSTMPEPLPMNPATHSVTVTGHADTYSGPNRLSNRGLKMATPTYNGPLRVMIQVVVDRYTAAMASRRSAVERLATCGCAASASAEFVSWPTTKNRVAMPYNAASTGQLIAETKRMSARCRACCTTLVMARGHVKDQKSRRSWGASERAETSGALTRRNTHHPVTSTSTR